MEIELDWRHWLGAGVVLVGLVFAGWKIMSRPSAAPTATAPSGANRRAQDAPETAGGALPAAKPNLPTAQ